MAGIFGLSNLLLGFLLVISLVAVNGGTIKKKENTELNGFEDSDILDGGEDDLLDMLPQSHHRLSDLDRMANLVEKISPELGELSDESFKFLDLDAPPDRQKRSTGRKTKYPRWFLYSCAKHFSGFYNCNTFSNEVGRKTCYTCRLALCHARGVSHRLLQNSFQLCRG